MSAESSSAAKPKVKKTTKKSSLNAPKQFVPQKMAKAASPGYKSTYKSVSPELKRLCDQIVDPDSVADTMRWPNTYGLSATYKSINTFDARFDDYGQSAVIVYPSIANAILTTAGQDYSFELPTAGAPPLNRMQQPISLSDHSPQTYLTDIWFFSDDHCVLPRNSGGAFLYPMNWNSADNTAKLVLLFSNIPTSDSGSMEVQVTWYDITGAQTHTAILAVPGGGNLEFTLNPVAATNINSWLSIRVVLLQDGFYDGQVTAFLREGGVAPFMSLNLPNVANHFISNNLNGSNAIIDTADKGFVSAQSLLLTYIGSDLQNGGSLAIARVPANTVLGSKTDILSSNIPQSNPYYDWIASLSSNRYDGGIKDGGYTFYLGEDERDYFYRPVALNYGVSHPYIAAAFNSTDVGIQSGLIRIKVITHVQFTTSNNIYSLDFSPHLMDSTMLQHICSMVHSSYCNPLHKEQIKEYLKKLGGRISRIITNPDNWLTAAKVASGLLL